MKELIWYLLLMIRIPFRKLFNFIMSWQLYQIRKKVYGLKTNIPLDFHEKYTIRYCRVNRGGSSLDICGRAWIMFFLDEIEKEYA